MDEFDGVDVIDAMAEGFAWSKSCREVAGVKESEPGSSEAPAVSSHSHPTEEPDDWRRGDFQEIELLTPIVKKYMDALPGFSNRVRMSGLWKLCARKKALDELFPENVDNSIGWQLRMIFDTGTGIHDFMQQSHLGKGMKIIIGMWVCPRCESKIGPGTYPEVKCPCWKRFPRNRRNKWLYEELKVYRGRSMTGHIDGVVHLNEDYLVEMKSINGDAFKFLRAPLVDNVYQANIYMGHSDPVLRKALIIYICKNTGEFREFLVKYDKRFLDDAGRKLNWWFGHKSVAESGICERECVTKTEKRAKYCDQVKVCFDQYLVAERMKEVEGAATNSD